ncbi:MAG: hypothetical protein BJ554DRAFT_1515, partial [Olpidium bornovanus]
MPPSIPVGDTAYGYAETDDGELKARKPPKIDRTVRRVLIGGITKSQRGPAFYNPNAGFAEESRTMKRGPKFSPSEVERLTFKKTDTPGPVRFEENGIMLKSQGTRPDRHAQQVTKPFPSTRHFPCECHPSRGPQKTRGGLASWSSRKRKRSRSLDLGRTVFGAISNRKLQRSGAHPLHPKNPLINFPFTVKSTSVSSSFPGDVLTGASKADRFAGRSSSFPGQGREGCLGTAVETPGPGAYSPSLQDGNRKLPGKFSPPRCHAEVEVNNSISPGPAAYSPDDVGGAGTLVRRGGHASRRGRDSGKAFGSLTDRFRTYKLKQEPGPGTYEVSEPLGSPSASGKQGAARVGRKLWSTKKTHGQLHRTGLSGLSTELAELAKQRYGTQTVPVFGSGMKRFESAPNFDVPPPGAYNTMTAFKNAAAHGRSSVSQRYQSPVSRTPRVPFNITADVPGPGKYEPKVPEQHTSLRRDDGTFL